MSVAEVALLLSSLSVGGLLTVLLKSFVGKKRLRYSKAFEYREARYKATLILLWTKVAFADRIEKLRNHRPDIRSEKDLDDELELEYHIFLLFASEAVLGAFKSFLMSPDAKAWREIAVQMRNDLYD